MWRLSFGVFLLIAGCTHEHEDTSSTELPTHSVTLWTETSELFMEYPTLIAGEEASFAVHLTWLDEFGPVSEGSLRLSFNSEEGPDVVTTADSPTSPGIFRPAVTVNRSGVYDLVIIVDASQRDTMVVEGVVVHESAEAVGSAAAGKASAEPLVTFLKEQQWNIDFRTEPVIAKSLSGSVRAPGEIIPKLRSEVIVAAPFTGAVEIDRNPQLPVIGTSIMSGQNLAVLTPSSETPDGQENFASRYVDAETDRELAAREYERARRLYEIEAISEKEFQEAEASYRRADAMFVTLNRYADTPQTGGYDFSIPSPIAGTIVETFLVPGRQIRAGDPLFRIINTSVVWLEANLPMSEAGKIKTPQRATFRIPGFDQIFEVNERNGKVISFGSVVDEATRTIPIVFEVANPDEELRIGMYAEVWVSTGADRPVLAIPETALIEEEGRYSVFIHVSGESFAKRFVEPGVYDRGYVEIQKGLSEGERVVTVGAYQVKLASLSTELPEHGHDH